MKLNKTQKIIIIIALFAMAIVVLFPPVARMHNDKTIRLKGRAFLFLVPQGIYPIDINIRRISFELLAIALLGSALIALFSLKKREI